jgi:superfamily II DNA or RNA helicase
MLSYILLHKPAGFPFYFITGEIPRDALKDLEEALSYPVKNADHAVISLAEKHAKANMEREKQGLTAIEYPPWDGKIHFLKTTKNGKSLYFPIGLKERAKQILSFYDIECRCKEEYGHEERHVDFVWNGPKLREYQKDAAVKVLVKQGGIIVVPTGGGKSIIGLRLVYAFGMKTLILVHKHEIFTQWCENIEKIFGLKGVNYGEGIKVFVPGNITVATVQTLHSGLKGKNPFAQAVLEAPHDLCIADEIHHFSSQTFYAVVTHIDAHVKIGMTATPHRDDGEDMRFEAAVGPIVVQMKPEDLIADGFLTKPVFEFIEVPSGAAVGRTFAQIYSTGIIHNQGRNAAICNRALELEKQGRQVYIHVERVVHGEILSKMLKAPFVYSKSKDRDETVSTFRKGFTRILISTLLQEGFDCPSVSALCMASGGKSEVAVIQRIGRALRPDPKFNNAIIVDFCDRGRYLALHALARYDCYVQTYGESIIRGNK